MRACCERPVRMIFRLSLLLALLLAGRVEGQDELLREDALDAMTEGRYARAADLYWRHLALHPKDGAASVNFADCVIRGSLDSRLGEAEYYIRNAYESGVARSGSILGRVLLRAGDQIPDDPSNLRRKAGRFREAADVLEASGDEDGLAETARTKAQQAAARLDEICRSRLREVDQILNGKEQVTLDLLKHCDRRLAEVEALDRGRSDVAQARAGVNSARIQRQNSLRESIEAAERDRKWLLLRASLRELQVDFPAAGDLAGRLRDAHALAEWEIETTRRVLTARRQRDLSTEMRRLKSLIDSAAVGQVAARRDTLLRCLVTHVDNCYAAGNSNEAEKWLGWGSLAGYRDDQIRTWGVRLGVIWREQGGKIVLLSASALTLILVGIWLVRRRGWKRAYRRLRKDVPRLIEAESPSAAFLRIRDVWQNYPLSHSKGTVDMLWRTVLATAQFEEKNGDGVDDEGLRDFLATAAWEVEAADAKVELVWLEAYCAMRARRLVGKAWWRDVMAGIDRHAVEFPALDGLAWVTPIFLSSLLPLDHVEDSAVPDGADWATGANLPFFPGARLAAGERNAVGVELTLRVSTITARFHRRLDDILRLVRGDPELSVMARSTAGLELLRAGDEGRGTELMGEALRSAPTRSRRRVFAELFVEWARLRVELSAPLDPAVELPALVHLSRSKAVPEELQARTLERSLEAIQALPNPADRIELLEKCSPEEMQVQDLLAADYVRRGRALPAEESLLRKRLVRPADDDLICHYLRVCARKSGHRSAVDVLADRGGSVSSLDRLENCLEEILLEKAVPVADEVPRGEVHEASVVAASVDDSVPPKAGGAEHPPAPLRPSKKKASAPEPDGKTPKLSRKVTEPAKESARKGPAKLPRARTGSPESPTQPEIHKSMSRPPGPPQPMPRPERTYRINDRRRSRENRGFAPGHRAR